MPPTSPRSGQRLLRCLLWTVAVCLLAGPILAQPSRRTDVPPPLRPWIEWALDETRNEGCRKIEDSLVCAWPGLLDIAVDADGARFSQTVVVNSSTDVVLPGSDEHWPQQVTVGAKPGVLVDRSGGPSIELPPGTHQIRGRLPWSRIPELLTIPDRVALLRLRVNGTVIRFPDRGASVLRLPATPVEAVPEVDEAAARRPDSLTLQVFRRLDDGVPLKVTTHIALDVSGKQREITLDAPLLPETRAVDIDSDLPSRLMPDGKLLVQAHAGRHQIRVVAVAASPLEKIATPNLEPPWPEAEIWVWRPSSELRDVVVQRALPVDPSRTELPPEWRVFTAFQLRPGQQLDFVTKRRGTAEAPPSELRLERTMWLDLDGEGWTIRDHIRGKMHRDWRLDLLEGELGRVVLGKQEGPAAEYALAPHAAGGTDQLITTNPDTRLRGVEIRRGAVDLSAEWRLDAPPGVIPAVGWSQDMQSVRTSVHLPPGWQPLHASGADTSAPSWTRSWTLLDALIILVLALAAARLAHPVWGAVMAVVLVLCHDVSLGGPPYVTWMLLLASMAMLRLARTGWFRSAARAVWFGSAALLVLFALSFSIDHVASALWQRDAELRTHEPEWNLFQGRAFGAIGGDVSYEYQPPYEYTEADQAGVYSSRGYLEAAAEREPPESDDRQDAAVSVLASPNGPLPSDPPLSNLPPPHEIATKLDPMAIPQTGPGIPTWGQQLVSLAWGSRVERTEQARVLLLSPAINSALSMLRVLLVGLLVWALLCASRRLLSPTDPDRPRRRPKVAAAALATGLLLAAGVTLWSTVAHAQPSPKLLNELHDRLTSDPELTPKPDCGRNCTTVPLVSARIAGARLIIEAEVHMAGPAVYELPGPAEVWVPREVRVDGRVTRELALMRDGSLYVRLDRGHHTVRLTGPLSGNEISLGLGNQPKRIEVEAPGWSVGGVEDGRIRGTLELRRLASDEAEAKVGEGETEEDGTEPPRTDLPVWLEVTRKLSLGVSWRVATQVHLESDTTTARHVRVPLLPGEHVTTRDVLVDNGEAQIEVGPNHRHVEWESVLDEREQLVLVAPADRPWTEKWELRCSPIWRCTSSGLHPLAHHDPALHWHQVFRPWPGEQLTVELIRPPAADGNHITIDEVHLKLTPDDRQTESLLIVELRSSTIGTQTITLPAAVEVTEMLVDGAKRPVRQAESILEVPLTPGKHTVLVTWKTLDTVGPLVRAPEVDLGRPVANAHVTIDLPHPRWPLWFGGASGSPAVLLWLFAPVLALIGFALSRLRWSPLKPWEWVVLALGMTQASVWLTAAVLGWPLVIHWRAGAKLERPGVKQLVQLGILASTVLVVSGLLILAKRGLTEIPDVLVIGSAFGGPASWYADHTSGLLPRPWVLSTSPVVWHAATLLWVLWLGWSIKKWLPWIVASVGAGGLWAKVPPPFRRPPGSPDAQVAPKPEPDPSESASPPVLDVVVEEPEPEA